LAKYGTGSPLRGVEPVGPSGGSIAGASFALAGENKRVNSEFKYSPEGWFVKSRDRPYARKSCQECHSEGEAPGVKRAKSRLRCFGPLRGPQHDNLCVHTIGQQTCLADFFWPGRRSKRQHIYADQATRQHLRLSPPRPQLKGGLHHADLSDLRDCLIHPASPRARPLRLPPVPRCKPPAD